MKRKSTMSMWYPMYVSRLLYGVDEVLTWDRLSDTPIRMNARGCLPSSIVSSTMRLVKQMLMLVIAVG
jgi:hypothetical protein